jgi:hypothetical protein
LLRHTHFLTIDPKVDRTDLSDFLILVLGFLLGLHLCPAGIGRLGRTARRKGQLVGFTDVGRDLELAMRKVIEFFIQNEHDPKVLAVARAGFHWYLASQAYHHAFEIFGWQYAVMDNVHEVSRLLDPTYRALSDSSPGHTRRPVNLASYYGIPLPIIFEESSSARPNARKLTKLRNELVHEARWLGHPLGYAADSESWDILQQLLHFNSQLLLAVLGVECGFRATPYTAQIHALDVK